MAAVFIRVFRSSSDSNNRARKNNNNTSPHGEKRVRIYVAVVAVMQYTCGYPFFPSVSVDTRYIIIQLYDVVYIFESYKSERGENKFILNKIIELCI